MDTAPVRALGPWLSVLAVALHRRRTVVRLIAVAVTLLLAALALPPAIDPDLAALLPPGDPTAAAYRRLVAEGGTNGVVVELAADDPAALDRLAPEVVSRLAALPEVAFATDRLPEELALHAALMSLDPAEVRSFTARVRGAFALGPRPQPLLLATVLGPPPVPAAPDLPWGEGVVFVKPRASNADPEASARVVASVREALAELPEGLRLEGMSGAHVVLADGVRAIRGDLRATGLVALLGVAAVLLVVLRRPRPLAAVLLPLLPAALAELWAVQLLFGAIDTYTSVGTALLMGLGVDHGLHLEAAVRGGSGTLEERIGAAWAEKGPVCALAAASSAFAFLPLASSDFGGLRHLGWALALGVGLALSTQLLLLPALLGEGVEPAAEAPPPPGSARARPLWLVPLLAMSLGIGAFAASRLRVQHDFTALSPDELVYSTADEATQARMRRGLPPVVVPVAEGALASEHARLERARAEGRLPHVRAVVSMAQLLPVDQEERVAALLELKALAADERIAAWPPGPRAALERLGAWGGEALDEADLPPGLADWLGHGSRILLFVDGDLFDMRVSGELLDELRAVGVRGAVSEQLVQAVLYRTVTADLPRVALLAVLALVVLVTLELRGRAAVVVPALLVGLAWMPVAWLAGGIGLDLANLVGLPILVGIVDDVVVHVADEVDRRGSFRAGLSAARGPAIGAVGTTLASFAALLAADSRGVRSLGALVVVGLSVGTVAALATLALAHARAGQRPR